MRQMTITNLLQSLPVWLPIWNNVNLESRLVELAAEGREIQNQADQESRALTPEEAGRIDALFQQFQATEALLAHQLKADGSVAYMTQKRGMGRQTTPEGPDSPRGGRSENGLDLSTLHNLQREPLKGRSQLDLFGRPHEKSPFASADEFLSIVVNNQFDPRLVRNAGMSEGVDTDGGYLVPVEYSSRILDAALEQSVLFPRVRVEPMASREKLVGTFVAATTARASPTD